ncbi:ARL14 effector protein isoform X2 [Anarrhichthys ocellatus]|uniref:ARL14 effector protein isoform X2 n=1 Tax=Anarrhichthys ocellatus TaxID=433405 RepID=UPI0012EEA9AC|nr:ARL14 effector protein isoform X2 [Anarrhichthys ocellatus]
MPVICAAIGCNNTFVKGSEFRFYRFPLSKPQLAGKWVNSLGMKNFNPTANTCLCSEHFRADCFRDYNGKQFLREDAVPTIFSQGQDSSKIELRKRGVIPKETNVVNPVATQADRDKAREAISLRRDKRGGMRMSKQGPKQNSAPEDDPVYLICPIDSSSDDEDLVHPDTTHDTSSESDYRLPSSESDEDNEEPLARVPEPSSAQQRTRPQLAPGLSHPQPGPAASPPPTTLHTQSLAPQSDPAAPPPTTQRKRGHSSLGTSAPATKRGKCRLASTESEEEEWIKPDARQEYILRKMSKQEPKTKLTPEEVLKILEDDPGNPLCPSDSSSDDEDLVHPDTTLHDTSSESDYRIPYSESDEDYEEPLARVPEPSSAQQTTRPQLAPGLSHPQPGPAASPPPTTLHTQSLAPQSDPAAPPPTTQRKRERPSLGTSAPATKRGKSRLASTESEEEAQQEEEQQEEQWIKPDVRQEFILRKMTNHEPKKKVTPEDLRILEDDPGSFLCPSDSSSDDEDLVHPDTTLHDTSSESDYRIPYSESDEDSE